MRTATIGLGESCLIATHVDSELDPAPADELDVVEYRKRGVRQALQARGGDEDPSAPLCRRLSGEAAEQPRQGGR